MAFNYGTVGKAFMQNIARNIDTEPQQQPQEPQQPQYSIDKKNVIGSFARMMGLTPEERAERDRKMAEGKAKMAGWTGLFDGLRHLGNLYYASQGARAQQFNDPYQQIDKNYQEALQRQDALDKYRQSYAQLLYNMQRQDKDEARKEMLSRAQADWYRKRDTNKYITKKDGGILRVDPETGLADEISPADPEYIAYQQERTHNLQEKTKTEKVRQRTMQQNADANTTRAAKTGNGKGSKSDKSSSSTSTKKWDKYIKK